MAIQQLMLGVGAKKKTYMEDIFSNYLWKGNNQDRTITNNIDLKKEGGMVWVKRRTADHSSILADTERDDPSLTGQKYISTDTNSAQSSDTNGIKYFYNTGFSTGSGGHVNSSSHNYSSYSFRRASGFFDVIKYTGNGSNGRQISHNLGSVPGCIWVKRIDAGTEDWQVYHRGNADTSNAGNYWLALNQNYSKGNSDRFYDLEPTSTYFTVSDHESINTNSYEYIAYLFAGGESTAATARGVHFNGSNDRLTIPTHADLAFGTGDFTIECWVKPTGSGTQMIYDGRDNLGVNRVTIYINSDYTVRSQVNNQQKDSKAIPEGAWTHVAVTRSGTTARFFINGIKEHEWTSSGEDLTAPSSNSYIGGNGNQNQDHLTGNISNFRIVKGTAVYTTSFKPPTEPLTNITNTKLLCCNQSTTTGSTVSPTTITDPNTSTASIDSPFDDPAGFVFGENKDQNVIKTGSYVGNGSSTGPEIYLGWEPQWVLIKRTDANEDWTLYDSMRGITTGDDDIQFKINRDYDDITGIQRMSLIANGFKIVSNDGDINQSGGNYVYTCIRRSDGYVGKPADAGTDVFDIEFGSGGSANPAFIGGFPVDFAINRELYSSGTTNPTSAGNYTGARLTGQSWLATHDNSSEQTGVTDWVFDSNTGWSKNYPSNYISWMWKRHAGMDVVTYKGDGVTTGRDIPHSCNSVPEMIWVKKRNSSTYTDWIVYHVGAGNTKYLRVSQNVAAATTINTWNNTTPTATHFTIGQSPEANNNGDDFIAMLFSSVDKISKCGTYAGSSSDVTVTTGFQPRFIIIKRTNAASHWAVYDTRRGINSSGSGGDYLLYTNDTNAQTEETHIDLSSTGFTVKTGAWVAINSDGNDYVYYAHA